MRVAWIGDQKFIAMLCARVAVAKRGFLFHLLSVVESVAKNKGGR